MVKKTKSKGFKFENFIDVGFNEYNEMFILVNWKPFWMAKERINSNDYRRLCTPSASASVSSNEVVLVQPATGNSASPANEGKFSF